MIAAIKWHAGGPADTADYRYASSTLLLTPFIRSFIAHYVENVESEALALLQTNVKSSAFEFEYE